jgi:uncharacterized repeat protein (TIGR03803 family)
MRISTGSIVGASVCAAILTACGGSGPQITVPLSQSPAGVTAQRRYVRPAYAVLYSFRGGTRDGQQPRAGLINANGTLYGTTLFGGSGSCMNGSFSGCGAVFAIRRSGKETLLYSFAGGSGDGQSPLAGLLNVNGTLYGTTYGGGAGCGSSGCGTVFSITPTGKETVLHSFKGVPDGLAPGASLTVLNGTLYGTTESGGTGYCNDGCGTVFSITTSGKETVLHSFSGSGDGVFPDAGLVNVGDTLYGTTYDGGANGAGTVFSLLP